MRFFVLASALGLVACARLPEYDYTSGSEDDASTGPKSDGSVADDANVSLDGGIDSAPPTSDAAIDSARPDSASTTCPSDPPPAGIDKCCSVPCIDRKQAGVCASCTACDSLKCKPTEVCCFRTTGKLECRSGAADCK